MKKIIILILSIFILFSCGKSNLQGQELNKKILEEKNDIEGVFSDYNFKNCIEEQKREGIESIKEQEKNCIENIKNTFENNNGYTNNGDFTNINYSEYNFDENNIIGKNLEIIINSNFKELDLDKLKNIISNDNVKQLYLIMYYYKDEYYKIFDYYNFKNLNSLVLDFGIQFEKLDFTLNILKDKINNSGNLESLEIFFNDYKLKDGELKIFEELNIKKLWLNGGTSDNLDIRNKKMKEILLNSNTLIEIGYIDYGVFRKKDGEIIFEKF